MVSAKDKNAAVNAVVSYLGLSSSTRDFPKGVKVDLIEDEEMPAEDDDFFKDLKGRMNALWNDNVGSLSKVPRMSNIDLAHYVNQMRAERGAKALDSDSPLIERWMTMLRTVDKNLVLLKVTSSDGDRLFLVKIK